MNQLRAKAPDALAEVARAFEPSLYRFALRIVRQDADAWDVVQQTLAAVVQKVDRFAGGPAELRSWVFTIAYRAAIDVVRGRHRAVPLVDDIAEELAEPVDLETEPADLRRAFATLDPTEQYLLTLKFQDGFSNLEIARIVGVSANHVGVLVFRAKQHLREALP